MKKLLLIFFIFTLTKSYAQATLNSNADTNPVVSLQKVSAYPNPFTVSTKITFESSTYQSLKFLVKNLLGKTVYYQEIEAEEGKNTFTFYRNSLKKGMYIYTLQSESEVISKRLIIK